MAHQRVSLKHDAKTPSVFDASDAGTGKTFVRIVAFAERRRKGSGKMLVLCTRSNMESVWVEDFAKFAPDLRVAVATAENRAAAFAQDGDVVVTNHDAIKWIALQPKSFMDDFSEVAIDESTAYKNPTSQRSKAAVKVVRRPNFKHRAAMTATPNPKTIVDIFNQVLLLDGGQRLGDSYYAFRNQVCQPEQVGRSKHAVQWKDKEGAEEAVWGLLSDIVIRHRREDCVDIPATQIYSVPYLLPAKQRKAYDQLEESQLLVMFDPADAVASQLTQRKATPKITAINAAAVANKLMQVASGAVYESTDNYHVVDTARYEMILDMCEERKHPLVFFQWKHQRDQLIAEATARKLSFAVLDGKASDAERKAMVLRYQAGHLDVLFAHPKSAAHGLTLTRGTSIIWASPTYDLEWWVQGNQRQARIGQKEKTEIVVVLAKDTLEERVYNEILMAKNERMTTLLDLFAATSPKVRKRA